MTQTSVLPFNKKTSAGREMARSLSNKFSGSSWMDDPVQRARQEEFERKMEEIFDSLPSKYDPDADGSRVITKDQFKLLQWAEKQMEIRRLQRACESILAEIENV